MKIKVSEYIVSRLVDENINTVFGYQGGNISHLIDSLGRCEQIEFVETLNEQSAAFAANAYAQLNESIGVALASSGPGAINLLNGIANAYFDSIPCIFFTGDVNTTAKKENGSLRQNSFQETDILSMVRPITKYCVSVDKPDNIIEELDKAITIAKTGRMGPVVINLPHDIQRSFISYYSDSPNNKNISVSLEPTCDEIESALLLIKSSHRPVLLVGGGMKNSKSRELILKLLDLMPIPVVSSLLGMDVLHHSHSCFRGVVGAYGNRAANLCLKYADCIVVLGNRLDDRQVGPNDVKYFYGKKIIHVDLDEHEIENKLSESLSIICDVNQFIEKLIDRLDMTLFEKWLMETSKMQHVFPSSDEEFLEMHPNDFLSRLSRTVEGVFSFDVGNNQMHSMQSVFLNKNSRTITSGGLGSMGYSLPAAIGASYVNNQKVYCITGDGGLQMNIQELHTVVARKLNINIVLLNNDALGMIYDLQTRMFPGNYHGTIEGYFVPDFKLVAEAYGFEYFCINSTSDYEFAVNLLNEKTRIFVEYKMGVDTYMKPQIGNGIFDQQPTIDNNYLVELERKLFDI